MIYLFYEEFDLKLCERSLKMETTYADRVIYAVLVVNREAVCIACRQHRWGRECIVKMTCIYTGIERKQRIAEKGNDQRPS